MITNEEHIELLMLRHISGETNSDEDSELLEILRQDKTLIKKMQTLRLAVSHTKQKEFDYSSAFSKFKDHTGSAKTKKLINLRLISGIAASLLIIIGLAVSGLFKSSPTPVLLGEANNTVNNITLHDGSHVLLNKHSQLFTSDKNDKTDRSVILEGEAFFQVSHDSLHPFTVQVNKTLITVLGTEFNVFSDTINKQVIVTVKSGTVKVSNNGTDMIITANEQITVNNSKNTIKETNTNIKNSDSWRTGILVFEQTPMTEVIQSVNKHFNANLRIGSSSIEDFELTASFNESDNLDNVIEVLNIVLNISIKKEDGYTVLYEKLNE